MDFQRLWNQFLFASVVRLRYSYSVLMGQTHSFELNDFLFKTDWGLRRLVVLFNARLLWDLPRIYVRPHANSLVEKVNVRQVWCATWLWFDSHAKLKFTTKMQIYEKLSCMRGFAWLAVKRANKVKMEWVFFWKRPHGLLSQKCGSRFPWKSLRISNPKTNPWTSKGLQKIIFNNDGYIFSFLQLKSPSV